METILDTTKVDNIVFEDVDTNDYPDFVDAHIVSADYDGEPMSDSDIEELNEDNEFIYEKLMEHLF
jgi:hypothetical protein